MTEAGRSGGGKRRYDILIAPSAARSLRRMDRPIQRRLAAAIDRLAEDPRPPGVRKLTGADDLWRIRVGEYRIVYEIADDRLIVTVIRVGHRREIYR